MEELTWKERLLGRIASLGWWIFSRASGYEGFVCDFAKSQEYPMLPCELWFAERDSKTDGSIPFTDADVEEVE